MTEPLSLLLITAGTFVGGMLLFGALVVARLAWLVKRYGAGGLLEFQCAADDHEHCPPSCRTFPTLGFAVVDGERFAVYQLISLALRPHCRIGLDVLTATTEHQHDSNFGHLSGVLVGKEIRHRYTYSTDRGPITLGIGNVRSWRLWIEEEAPVSEAV